MLSLALGAWADAPSPRSSRSSSAITEAQARALLEQAYAQNRAAFKAKDLTAILAQRTADFHAITPDGVTHDAAEMSEATRRLLANVIEFTDISFKLGPVALTKDDIAVDVEQHTIRRQMRDGVERRLENWVTQRETWIRSGDGLKIRMVDNLRDQCVLVDGAPRDASQEAACKKRGVLPPRSPERG
jgi:hypothetical protein